MNILKNALRMLLRSPRKDVQSEFLILSIYHHYIHMSTLSFTAVIKKCQSSSLDNAISELTSEDCTDISGKVNYVLAFCLTFLYQRYLSGST